MRDRYIEILKKRKIFYIEDRSLRNNSYAHVGGSVQVSCFPKCLDSFVKIICDFRSENLSHKILGKTTNVLFLDSVHYTCFIFTDFLDDVNINGTKVRVESGRLLGELCRDLALAGLSGAEGLEGIPGTIGGALILNAGAYGYTISDYLKSVTVLDTENKIRILKKDDMYFDNRSAVSLDGMVVLEASFDFKFGEHDCIEKLTRRFHISRHTYQEWVFPNLGSIYVVPSMNIHLSVLDFMAQNGQYLLSRLLQFILLIWYKRGLFFIRRSFPEFNLPQRLIGHFHRGCYTSSIASNCTINTFTNKGNSSLEIIEYMAEVKMSTSFSLRLENEIIIDSIAKVIDKKQYEREVKIINDVL